MLGYDHSEVGFGGYYLVWIEKRRLEGREEKGCFALVDIPKLSSCNNEKRQFLVDSLSKSRRNALNWMVVCHRHNQEKIRILRWHLYQFPRATITNCHELGGLKQQRYIFSQSWRLEFWNQGISRAVLFPKSWAKNISLLLLAFGSLGISCFVVLVSASIFTRPSPSSPHVFCVPLLRITCWI